VLEQVDVFSGADCFHRYPNGDDVYFEGVTFVARAVSGDLVADGREGVALAAFALDALPNDLLGIARRILAGYQARVAATTGAAR
jgi:hypothetical protein